MSWLSLCPKLSLDRGHFQTTCGRHAVWCLSESSAASTHHCRRFQAELYATHAEAMARLPQLHVKLPEGLNMATALGVMAGHVLDRYPIGSAFPVVMDEISQDTADICDTLFSNIGDLLPSIRTDKRWIDWGRAMCNPEEGADALLLLIRAELQPALRGKGLSACLWRDLCKHLAQRHEPVFRVVVCPAGFLSRPFLTPLPSDIAMEDDDTTDVGAIDEECGSFPNFVRKTLRPCGFRCLREEFYGCVAHDFNHATWHVTAADPPIEPDVPPAPPVPESTSATNSAKRPREETDANAPRPAAPKPRLDDAEIAFILSLLNPTSRPGQLPPAPLPDDARAELMALLPTPLPTLPPPAMPPVAAVAPAPRSGYVPSFRSIIAPGRACSCGACPGPLSRNMMRALLFTTEVGGDYMSPDLWCDMKDLLGSYATIDRDAVYPKAYGRCVSDILKTMAECLRGGVVPTVAVVTARLHLPSLQPLTAHGGSIQDVIKRTAKHCEKDNGPGGTVLDLFGGTPERLAEIEAQACDKDSEWATLMGTLLDPAAAQ